MLTSGEKQAVTTPFLTCQVKHQLTAIRTTIVMTRRARTISPTTEKQAGEDVENSKVYAVPLGTVEAAAVQFGGSKDKTSLAQNTAILLQNVCNTQTDPSNSLLCNGHNEAKCSQTDKW